MTVAIITRAEAKSRGLKRWFSGDPCKQGHVAERSTATGVCVECRLASVKAWGEANPDKVSAYKKKHHEANKDKIRDRMKARSEPKREAERARKKADYEANADKIRARRRARYAANVDKARAASREWHGQNQDKARAVKKAYREANPGKVRAARKAYHEANRDKINARSTAWREANRDKAQARQKAYREANADAVRKLRTAHRARQRARKRGQMGVVSPDIRERLRKLQKNKCTYCAASLKRTGEHLDHIMPLALGGLHDDANLQLLCPPCNLSKNAKHPNEFARKLGRLL
jgi:5-methylcytosine-specific restriction endonuclease McrA